MFAQLSSLTQFVRDNDWRTILAHVNSRDAHPLLQFIKYGICGLGAFITHQLIWFPLSMWVFPAFDHSLPDATRAMNTAISNLIAVFFSTTVAYVTNIMWVFKSGRHSRTVEIASFFIISAISFSGGLLAGPWLIKVFGISTWIAQGSMAVTSVLINYVCRKLFIFKH
ncbi:GtrA-like protein [Prosthecobacter fusiformis]|uniref:GtrA-like protein n=1 Tax=Prosthecobacter fusiformis TaxID=48464 RepID=A0A4R7RUS7_9BACT|nr:GtrA family protein [Prosthecobacter fusiformis]TDU68197.1 GtrA-like protein [Prosthecobacter fusiformis]